MAKFKHSIILIIVLSYISSCKDKTVNNKDSDSPSRPNIVWIMADDHSYQTLSAYDDRFIQTPHMDQIGQEGVRFTNSFVGNSLCAPSRATLQTGKLSHKNGVMKIGDVFDASQQTFPKLLQQAGYQTALVGKWHLQSAPTGYDYSDRLVGQGDYYNTHFITNGDTTRSHGYVTNVITDKSLQWLENRDTDKPFSLQIHHKATHRVWMPDTSKLHRSADEFWVSNSYPAEAPDKWARKADSLYEVPPTYYDDYEGRPAAAAQKMSIIEDMDVVYDLKMLDEEGQFQTKYRDMYAHGAYEQLDGQHKQAWDAYDDPIIQKFKKYRPAMSNTQFSRWKYQRFMQDYLKTVESIDDNVGRVIDYLKEHDLYDNTLIVYTSDQGFFMGEHGWFDKRYMYEQSMRTPLLMKFPESIETREQADEMVQNIDWAPTILDVAGVEVPDDIQGKSLVPIAQHPD